MWTVGRYNWSSLKMAWMHTVCVGPDLADAKVCVWLNAPLDKTGHPFILACRDAHICTHMYTHRVTKWLVRYSGFHPPPLITVLIRQRSLSINILT